MADALFRLEVRAGIADRRLREWSFGTRVFRQLGSLPGYVRPPAFVRTCCQASLPEPYSGRADSENIRPTRCAEAIAELRSKGSKRTVVTPDHWLDTNCCSSASSLGSWTGNWSDCIVS